MVKRTKDRTRTKPASTDRQFEETPVRSQLPSSAKRILSVFLLVYLVIIALGPLSNPVGSEFLTRPLARLVAPVHRALFLGHGYRFFGPDPGPSHMLVFRVTTADGKLIEDRFPNRERIWPRLLYHRWFMLSETIYNEHSLNPDVETFTAGDKELGDQIDALRSNGKFGPSEKLAIERRQYERRFQDAQQRIGELVKAVAEHLVEHYQGIRIELFLQQRDIPPPIQILTGAKPEDARFLSSLRKIGEYQLDSDGRLISLELPDSEQVNQ